MIELKEKYKQHLHRQVEFYKTWLDSKGFDNLFIHFNTDNYFYQDDQTKNYRPNPFAIYIVNEPKAKNSWIQIKKSGDVIVYQFEKNGYWDDPIKTSLNFFSDFISIEKFYDNKELFKKISIENSSVLGEHIDLYKELEFKSINDPDLILDINTLRRVKTEYELNFLYQAQYDAIVAHKLICKNLHKGLSEVELLNIYLNSCKIYSEDQGYKAIIAYNEGGSILHYNNLKFNKPNKLLSLLIDAGSVYKGYQADITRTYCIDNNEYFSSLIAAVVEQKHQIIQEVKPGISTIELQKKCLNILNEILINSGLVKGSPDELIELGITKAFMPHGVMHSMGINVHDPIGKTNMDNVSTTIRSSLKLEIGNVMTIEPGLYFIKQLLEPFRTSNESHRFDWKAIDMLYAYGGIRTEDNIYLDKDHIINLTADLEN